MTDIVTIVDRIEKWLEELESGRHKQGLEFLRKNDCYCCLGVAAEFVLHLKHETDSTGVYEFDTEFGFIEQTLAGDSYSGIGLLDDSGTPLKSSIDPSLTELNDSYKSFIEIASIIREDLATSKYGYFIETVYPEWKKRHAK